LYNCIVWPVLNPCVRPTAARDPYLPLKPKAYCARRHSWPIHLRFQTGSHPLPQSASAPWPADRRRLVQGRPGMQRVCPARAGRRAEIRGGGRGRAACGAAASGGLGGATCARAAGPRPRQGHVPGAAARLVGRLLRALPWHRLRRFRAATTLAAAWTTHTWLTSSPPYPPLDSCAWLLLRVPPV
jgi:hypothetical protein